MNLVLPTPTVTLGPEWANEINAALSTIDAHDHSSGKGVPITPAGLDIISNLDIQSNKVFNLKSTQYTDQAATLTGATNASSVYSKSGDLWWTNGAGIAVQLTSGSSIISVPASADSFQFDAINTSLTPIGPSDNYVIIDLDCSAPRTIVMPPASAITPGRVYMIHDATGQSETNNITIQPDASDNTPTGGGIDGQNSLIVNSNYATVFLASNGVNKWSRL